MKKIILILMLTIFGFSYSNDKTYNIKKNYSVENINSFSIINKNASIEVLPTDSKEITLSITTNVKLKIEKQIKSKELEVKVLPPRSIFPFSFFSKNETSIIIEIPKDIIKRLSILSRNGSVTATDLILDLKITTRNGRISMSNIKGNSNVLSKNGKIKITDYTGNVKGLTHNGKIYINNINGNIDCETRNGKIIASDSKGVVSLKTYNGSIDLKNSSFIKTLETNNGDINANSKILLKNGKIKTSNGDINFNIDKLEGNNEISTSRGHITLTTKDGEFNTNSISEDEFKDISKNITIEGDKINIIIKK